MGFCRGTRPRLLSRRRRRRASAPHFEKPISGRSGEWRSRANRARHSHNRRAVHPWIVAVILAAAGAARDGRGFFFCFFILGTSGKGSRRRIGDRRKDVGVLGACLFFFLFNPCTLPFSTAKWEEGGVAANFLSEHLNWHHALSPALSSGQRSLRRANFSSASLSRI